jgi:hypothetical protein
MDNERLHACPDSNNGHTPPNQLAKCLLHLGLKSTGFVIIIQLLSGLENREYGRRDPLC